MSIRCIILPMKTSFFSFFFFLFPRNCTVYFFDVQPICQRWLYAAILANRLTSSVVIPFGVANTSQTITVRGSNSCHGGFYLNNKASRNDPNNGYIWENSLNMTVETLRMDNFFEDALRLRHLPPIALIKVISCSCRCLCSSSEDFLVIVT